MEKGTERGEREKKEKREKRERGRKSASRRSRQAFFRPPKHARLFQKSHQTSVLLFHSISRAKAERSANALAA